MKLYSTCEESTSSVKSLVGCPLASPFRRICAFQIDLVLLLLPSVVVAVLSAALVLSITHPEELTAIQKLFTSSRQERAEDQQSLMKLAPLLVRIEAPGLPPEVEVAVRNSDLNLAAEILSNYRFNFSLNFFEVEKPIQPGAVRVEIGRLIPKLFRGIAFFGVGALYFTFFTLGKKQSTLGKRLMGIHVVSLNNHPLSIWESFERFGGYFASFGTFGLGLIDLWRDPNRRLAHDRIANTVVMGRTSEKVHGKEESNIENQNSDKEIRSEEKDPDLSNDQS